MGPNEVEGLPVSPSGTGRPSFNVPVQNLLLSGEEGCDTCHMVVARGLAGAARRAW